MAKIFNKEVANFKLNTWICSVLLSLNSRLEAEIVSAGKNLMVLWSILLQQSNGIMVKDAW